MAIRFEDNPSAAPVPDLSGLEVAIRLKADLLNTLAATARPEWARHMTGFAAALDQSGLKDTTALFVLLTDLCHDLELLVSSGKQQDLHPSPSKPTLAFRLPSRRDEMLSRFRRYILDVLLPAAERQHHVSPIAAETKRIIDERYADALTLDLLAEAVGRSKRHLASVFLTEFGVSVHGYLTRVRLEHALALIREGQKIEAVSLLVGYRSKKNFYRNLSAHLGLTPTAYRTAASRLRWPAKS